MNRQVRDRGAGIRLTERTGHCATAALPEICVGGLSKKRGITLTTGPAI